MQETNTTDQSEIEKGIVEVDKRLEEGRNVGILTNLLDSTQLTTSQANCVWMR
jgi:hypothetical protein